MRNKIFILILLFINHLSFGQVHPDWEEKDRQIITSVKALNRENPKEVEKLFFKNLFILKEKLGFGWSQSNIALTGGYIRIGASFYYYNDSLVSYIIQPEIPYDTIIQNRYLKWYAPYYTQFDTVKYRQFNRDIVRVIMKPFKYNEAGILKPLKEYEKISNHHILSNKLIKYMSPESGLSYGWGGGYPPAIFLNRKSFNEIKDSLTNDDVIGLLYSINPASRLTAIEYCIKTNSQVLKQQKFVNWINKIYDEVPQIFTLNGCDGGLEDSRKLVQIYSKINDKSSLVKQVSPLPLSSSQSAR